MISSPVALVVDPALPPAEAALASAPPQRLPQPTALALTARFVAVLSISLWYGLRGFVGTLTEGFEGPRALRLCFERLGPIYVKVGQLVASGEALFPARYAEEFRTLLDRVPPFPFSDVSRIIEEDLGQPMSALFLEVDPAPMAAASIAQFTPRASWTGPRSC